MKDIAPALEQCKDILKLLLGDPKSRIPKFLMTIGVSGIVSPWWLPIVYSFANSPLIDDDYLRNSELTAFISGWVLLLLGIRLLPSVSDTEKEAPAKPRDKWFVTIIAMFAGIAVAVLITACAGFLAPAKEDPDLAEAATEQVTDTTARHETLRQIVPNPINFVDFLQQLQSVDDDAKYIASMDNHTVSWTGTLEFQDQHPGTRSYHIRPLDDQFSNYRAVFYTQDDHDFVMLEPDAIGKVIRVDGRLHDILASGDLFTIRLQSSQFRGFVDAPE